MLTLRENSQEKGDENNRILSKCELSGKICYSIFRFPEHLRATSYEANKGKRNLQIRILSCRKEKREEEGKTNIVRNYKPRKFRLYPVFDLHKFYPSSDFDVQR